MPDQAQDTPEKAIHIRTVRGWLLGCIKDHGPITEENVDSAAKRLVGQMASLNLESYWRRRYRNLKFAYDRLLARVERQDRSA